MKQLLVILSAMSLMAAASAADIQAGKAKAAMCAGCHGANGISAVPIYPNLKGQKAAYLEKQLKAFRDGTRKNPVMAPMAKGLSDADIANLAAYFESLGAN
ncbi:MAG: cytochrome c [Gammaproteobacteria bacterium]|nr:MAG: cytochrome c [Gammaproteobacteria bacterium]